MLLSVCANHNILTLLLPPYLFVAMAELADAEKIASLQTKILR